MGDFLDCHIRRDQREFFFYSSHVLLIRQNRQDIRTISYRVMHTSPTPFLSLFTGFFDRDYVAANIIFIKKNHSHTSIFRIGVLNFLFHALNVIVFLNCFRRIVQVHWHIF